jgi:protein phosphatase
MNLIATGNTDIGRKRSTNQDSYYLGHATKLFIVADGMGGHNGGDIASQMAVRTLPEFIENHHKMEPVQLLKAAFADTNNSIKKYGEKHAELAGMGTTVVCFFFKGQNIYIGNVGDSRAYLINQQRIFQLSSDHSLVQEKLNLGVYTREQAALDSQRNILVRTVGFDSDLEVDVFVYKVNKNDLFLSCSDGLHGKVSDEDIVYIINKHIPVPSNATQSNLDKAVLELIALANENGGQDNITAILLVAQ